jgi:hypothetical protein
MKQEKNLATDILPKKVCKITKRIRRRHFTFWLNRIPTSFQYLFVIAPMRSGSSLLVHILSSNPAIKGYGESHVGYNTNKDLIDLIIRTKKNTSGFHVKRLQYVMDKMVWNYPFSEELLLRKDMRFIFLLRDPAASYNSMAGLGKAYSVHTRYQDARTWFAYYKDRLAAITQLAEQIHDRERCIVLRYESLLEKTADVLDSMKQFLNTKEPFSENYILTRNTGAPQYGDSSATLKSGRILKGRNEAQREFILPDNIYQDVYQAQDDCLKALRELCRTAE